VDPVSAPVATEEPESPPSPELVGAHDG
jgi:hypothetical protein